MTNHMSNVQRIARNTTLLLLSNVVGFVLGFFFTMYIARYLAAEGFGVLSFALAFTAIFGVLTDIGLQTLMIREIARDKTLAQKYLGNIAVLKVFLSIITFGLIALTAQLAHYPADTVRVIYLLGLSMVLGSFSSMFYGVFRAHERMEFEALGGALGGGLLLAGAFWGIHHDYSIAGFAWVYFVVSIIMLGYGFVVSAWKFTLPRIEVDLGFWKQTLKLAWPFGLAAVFVAINSWIGQVMLSSMKGNEAVGWYNAANRLVIILQFIPLAYFGAVFPSMSRFHITSKDFLKFIQERSLKYMLILGIPIAVGSTILAEKIILLIFGSGYHESIIVLQILVWATAFSFVSGIFANLFQSINKAMIPTKILIICAVVNIILNVALIPKYSSTGASITIVVTSFVALALSFFWGSRVGFGISVKNLANIAVKVLIASAVMGLPVYYFRNFYILALIPLVALLYFVVLYIIGAIDKDDKLLLRQIIGRQQPAAADDENKDLR